jgi:hypothetical protein
MVKRTEVKMRRLILLFLLAALTQAALADVFMKQKQRSDGVTVMGHTQPPKDVVQTVWLSDNAIRTDGPEQSMIIDMDKKTWTLLDHNSKSYTELSMDLGKAAGIQDMPAEERAQFQNFMKNMMKIDISVSETGESKTINGWKCRKYIQKIETAMGPSVSNIWATREIDIDQDLYARFTASLLAQQPGLRESMDAMIAEMKKIKGISVLSETTMTLMGQEIKSSTELIECREAKAPAGTFDLPGGYKKKDQPDF